MFQAKTYHQYKLIEGDDGIKQYAKVERTYYCLHHKYATKDDFIEVTVKKTGNVIKKCVYCERTKIDNKKIAVQDWKREKEEVSDYYVRRVLSASSKKSVMTMDDYPQDLVEAKRAVIKLKRETNRLCQPLKQCNKHGKLYIDDVILSGKERSGKQRYKCRRCMKDYHDKHYQLNKADVLLKQAKYRDDNRKVIRLRKKESHLINIAKHVTLSRISKGHADHLTRMKTKKDYRVIIDQRKIEKAPDYYIKRLLTKHSPGLKYADIPPEMVEAKRAILMLRRGLKIKRDEEFYKYLEDRKNVGQD